MSLVAILLAAGFAGLWTNEEQVSFAIEAGEPPPAWAGLQVDAAGSATPVDAFGATTGPTRMLTAAETATPERIALQAADGSALEMRRARPFRCWAGVPRREPGPGGEDWWGRRDIPLHDQGGRALLQTDEPVPQRFTLKMRNVVWPSGPNQPSLVLYVLTPEAGERAIAYSWADPQAKRVGINIRTIQASCTLAE